MAFRSTGDAEAEFLESSFTHDKVQKICGTMQFFFLSTAESVIESHCAKLLRTKAKNEVSCHGSTQWKGMHFSLTTE
jgi:hypothetical protein